MIILLSIFWTPSFAQTQDSSKVCYTIEELKVIALEIVSGKECKELLELSKQEIAYKDTIYAYSQRRAENFRKQLELKDAIIEDTNDMLEEMQEALNLEIKDHNATRWKWRIGTGIFVGVGIFLLVTK